MKKTVFISILLMNFALVKSQSLFSGGDNSIGLRQINTTTRGLGMGGTGLAILDSVSMNPQAPASWRYLKYTRINISGRYNYIQTEVFNQKFTSRNGNFNSIQLAIPLRPEKFYIGGSISPYSRVNVGYTLNIENEDGNYQQNIFYEGSISRGHLGLVWAVNDWFSFSGGLNFFFGSIRDRHYLFFNSPTVTDDFHEIKYQFRGPGLGTSFHLNFIEDLFIAGFVDFKPDITFTRITQSPITFEEEREEFDTTFPLYTGMGISYQFHPQWTVSTDFTFQDLSEGLVDKKTVDNLETFYHIGMGIEHAHKTGLKRSFLNKIDTRAGVSYRDTGYLFANEPLKEYAGHIGFGFPFFNDLARIDIAFTGGIRGEKSKTIAEEFFLNTFITLSAGELWFQKIR